MIALDSKRFANPRKWSCHFKKRNTHIVFAPTRTNKTLLHNFNEAFDMFGDKRIFQAIMKASSYVPRSVETMDDVLELREKYVLLKEPLSSQGEGITRLEKSKINRSVLCRKHHVIQEMLSENLLLVRGCKFHVRMFVFWQPNVRMLMHWNGLTFVANKAYDSTSLDKANICTNHAIHHQTNMRPLSQLISCNSLLLSHLQAMLADIGKRMEQWVNFTRHPTDFGLYALDVLFTKDMIPQVTEINFRPDMSSSWGFDVKFEAIHNLLSYASGEITVRPESVLEVRFK